MSNRKGRIPPPGELRRSQVITTFGPGAMVDLPDHSIIVGGLEMWTDLGREQIHEDRLAERICELLELDERKIPLYTPPIEVDDPRATQTGITCFSFPEWFVAQHERSWTDAASGQLYRSRPLVHWRKLVRRRFLPPGEKKGVPVVPLRFVQACPNGHISDIDWYRFVHNGKPPVRGQLWIDEGGTGADLTEIFIRCEATKIRRSLGLAKAKDSKVLGRCQGQRPWLGRVPAEDCRSQTKPDEPEYNRLLVRSASHAYFSQVVKAISLPEKDQLLREAVAKQWEDELRFIEDLDDLRRLRRKKKPKVEAALGELDDEDIWAEIQRRLAPGEHEGERKSIKQAEIETLMSDRYDGREDAKRKFLARKRDISGLSPALRERIERIVLVERLREVRVQIGFTRFDSPSVDIDDSLTLPVQPAPLSLDLDWLPAIELLGEGVFIGFDPEAVQAWLDGVRGRGKELRRGFDAWKKRRELPDSVSFPGLPYIMLHTLSHLLINAVALECGYSASAISERVYAGRSGYGILLYTGTPGSEGTLGGLIEVGKRIEDHLAAALTTGRLCSNDPLCAQHVPDNAHEERFLHGAACHGCVLIGEPSCERRNEYLDRALVVPTVEGLGVEFFPDGAVW